MTLSNKMDFSYCDNIVSFCKSSRTHMHLCMSTYVCITIGATTVEAYFPKGSRWYDIYTNKVVSAGGASMTLDCPIDYIPVS